MQKIPDHIIHQLTRLDDYPEAYHPVNHGLGLPSTTEVSHIMDLFREILFPGFFSKTAIHSDNLRWYIGWQTREVFQLLTHQIEKGFCYNCPLPECETSCEKAGPTAENTAMQLLHQLPNIRAQLISDIRAILNRDPAANNPAEVIFCYPGIRAITHYRIAHALLQLNVPLLPRIITETAHAKTGIDIHPGASIGHHFAIDHGTGVVIGETCKIGNHVTLYQGVTLGARSFPTDAAGKHIKGPARHPIIEDRVTIYAGATILGAVTIGEQAIIGGNVWITKDIKPRARITQIPAQIHSFSQGEGI